MNLQSFKASPREMITFDGLLTSSMGYFPLVLCVISKLKYILLHQNFGKSVDANFFYYSIYDRFIQRQPCVCMRAFMRVCIC